MIRRGDKNPTVFIAIKKSHITLGVTGMAFGKKSMKIDELEQIVSELENLAQKQDNDIQSLMATQKQLENNLLLTKNYSDYIRTKYSELQSVTKQSAWGRVFTAFSDIRCST